MADPFRDLPEREPELVDQDRVRARFLRRRELFAGDVLDESEQERVAVVGLADQRRPGGEARLARSAPAPLACDQLPAAGQARPDDDRLDDTLAADGVGEPDRRL